MIAGPCFTHAHLALASGLYRIVDFGIGYLIMARACYILLATWELANRILMSYLVDGLKPLFDSTTSRSPGKVMICSFLCDDKDVSRKK